MCVCVCVCVRQASNHEDKWRSTGIRLNGIIPIHSASDERLRPPRHPTRPQKKDTDRFVHEGNVTVM